MSNAALAALMLRAENNDSQLDDVDFSLPDNPELVSIQSSFTSPPRRTVPPTSLLETPRANPSGYFARRMSSRNNDNGAQDDTPVAGRAARPIDDFEDGGTGNQVDTPAHERSLALYQDTPVASRPKKGRASVGGALRAPNNMTLREQERVIDELKKSNFSLKLKVHYLEERLTELAPEQLLVAAQANTQLKVEVAQRGREIKNLKKLVLTLQNELEAINQNNGDKHAGVNGNFADRHQGLLRQKDMEISDLKQQLKDAQDSLSSSQASASTATSPSLTQVAKENDELRSTTSSQAREIRDLKFQLRDMDEDLRRSQAEEPHVAELQEENFSLRNALEESHRSLEEAESEIRLLEDELRLSRVQHEQDRSVSVAEIREERSEQESLHQSLGVTRDRLAAANIELEQKEEDIDRAQAKIQQWEQAYEELRQELATRENEFVIMEEDMAKLHQENHRLNTDLDVYERQKEDLDTELAGANGEITRLSDCLTSLEEDMEQAQIDLNELQGEHNQLRQKYEDEKQDLNERISIFKSKYTGEKESHDMTYRKLAETEQQLQDAEARRENLHRDLDALEAELSRERRDKDDADREIAELTERIAVAEDVKRSLEKKEREWRNAHDDLESDHRKALKELNSLRALVDERGKDVDAMQAALRDAETKSRRLGETLSTDRFSLELELQRAQRDLARSEEALEKLNEEYAELEAKSKERANKVDQLTVEKQDLEAKLAAQIQDRLNYSAKLDEIEKRYKTLNSDYTTYQHRTGKLEDRLQKEQTELRAAEKQYKEQLSERNTLLLAVWQSVDKLVGQDKSPKKNGLAPFTNFAVFHDNMTARLELVVRLRQDFRNRCEELERRNADRLKVLQREIEAKWKTLDGFETRVKKLPELKDTWRRKFLSKEGELAAAKSRLTDLEVQINSLTRPTKGAVTHDSTDLRGLNVRVKNAESRAQHAENLRNQADREREQERQTFNDRVKEYERQLKLAQEALKREKQGSKERIKDLEKNVDHLQRERNAAVKRDMQLGEVLETAKTSSTKS